MTVKKAFCIIIIEYAPFVMPGNLSVYSRNKYRSWNILHEK